MAESAEKDDDGLFGDESPFGPFSDGDRSKQLQLLERTAFDEMNLTDIAIGTLSDPIAVTPGETVAFGPGLDITPQPSPLTGLCQLPARHSQRTLLALMWLTKEQNRFTQNRVKVKLRTLYEQYMYPHRTYSANNKVLASVLEEIHRMAACRIRSNRWYDKETGQTRVVDLALIADVLYEGGVQVEDVTRMIRDENGRGLGDLEIEIHWGPTLYESIAHKYTKALDARTFLAIDRPLDQKFYRFLDRQCWPGHRAAGKAWEMQYSCTKFATQVLGMRSKTIDKGGRSASTYVVKQLEQSLRRLNAQGPAHFRMEIDKGRADHALAFRRIEKPVNEVHEVDAENDFHLAFLRHAHGVPEEALQAAPAPTKTSRANYARWIDRYEGLQKAVEIMQLALEEFRKVKQRKTEYPTTIRDLNRFQTAAEARWAKRQLQAAQGEGVREAEVARRDLDKVSKMFGAYCSVLSFAELSEAEERAILEFVEKDLDQEENIRPEFRETVVRVQVRGRRCEAHKAISQEEFYAFESDAERDARLRAVHGHNGVLIGQLELLAVIGGREELSERERYEALTEYQPAEVVEKAFFIAPIFSQAFKDSFNT